MKISFGLPKVHNSFKKYYEKTEKLRLFLHGADSKQSGNITIQFRHTIF